jgi:acyl-CoA dehydrogenase
MYFTEEHNLFRQGLKDFLQKEVVPFIDEWEEQQQIPKALWKKFGDMGYLGLNVPEEYGGINADFFYSVIYIEEVSKVFSGGFSASATASQFLTTPHLMKYGSDFLKEKYLKPNVSGDVVSSLAITEPGAGSDVMNIKTTARLEGDYYIVNGQKTFITNAVYGDFILTVVKTDPNAGMNGMSILVIDRNAEGVSAKKLDKLGWHASDTAELWFDNVKVPKENLLGEEGQGFIYVMSGFQLERLVMALGAIAGCEAAIDYTLKYMSERSAFNRPINKFQVLRHKMVQLMAEVESLKFYNYYAAKLYDDGIYAVKESTVAKMLSCDLSDKVVYNCLQMFGGYGFMEEYKIARMYRDSRILTIGGGTSEIMKEILSKMLIDDKQYSDARKTVAPKPKQATSEAAAAPAKDGVDVEKIIAVLSKKAAEAQPLGNTLKFDFGGKHLLIDGLGTANQTRESNEDAQCTIIIAADDLWAMMQGTLNPMSAFMGGKFKVLGDMSVAMKLSKLF